MRSGAFRRSTPILLVLGGIAAPLAFAQLFVWNGTAGELTGMRPAAQSQVPSVVPAGMTGDCSSADAGVVALGPAVTMDDNSYAVAEGEARTSGHRSIQLLHRSPVILGSRLRIRGPVAGAAGCQPDPAYQPAQPQGDAFNT